MSTMITAGRDTSRMEECDELRASPAQGALILTQRVRSQQLCYRGVGCSAKFRHVVIVIDLSESLQAADTGKYTRQFYSVDTLVGKGTCYMFNNGSSYSRLR